MRTVEELIKERGYELIIGYDFGFEKPDYGNVFISVEDIQEKLKQEPIRGYWHEKNDFIITEEEVIDEICEQYCFDNDVDLDNEDILQKLLSELR